ncbi:hypothetical protein TUM20983_37350 [Mycobacterium antarcticum]|uniref:hypothetical protein n=1 Tax=Mycolicibacterium sp. TUM20983 TaxID=3023369 RepID=UPI0023A65664|nr:hypothetical protein [Mycolicibacterium sp. TUM20983]GLP76625.1 hypothetical protein TUM20983_37350 [Mycolicibacterium sp. TUM20983]
MDNRPPSGSDSPAYVGFLRLEGTLAILFGLIGMVGPAVTPLRGDDAAAVRPLDLVGLAPLIVVAVFGWWLLRRRHTHTAHASITRGLTSGERRSIRAKMRGLVVVVISAVLIPDHWMSALITKFFGPLPDEWMVVQGVLGVAASLYGIWVVWRLRLIARAQRAGAVNIQP